MEAMLYVFYGEEVYSERLQKYIARHSCEADFMAFSMMVMLGFTLKLSSMNWSSTSPAPPSSVRYIPPSHRKASAFR